MAFRRRLIILTAFVYMMYFEFEDSGFEASYFAFNVNIKQKDSNATAHNAY